MEKEGEEKGRDWNRGRHSCPAVDRGTIIVWII